MLRTFTPPRTLKCLLVTVQFISSVSAADKEVSFIGVVRSRPQLHVVAVDSTQAVATMTRLFDLHRHSCHHPAQQIAAKEDGQVY